MSTHAKVMAFAIGLVVLASGGSDRLQAADGAVPISHGLAMAGGVTPGDAAGYPVTITLPGLYRLTGNLTMPDANTGGIAIQSDDVTIDLNGFAINGPTTCTGSGSTLVCAPTGSGAGIASGPLNTPRHRITIRNGTIKGAGGQGIDLAPSAIVPATNHLVEDMVVINSGVGGAIAGGIRVGMNSMVRRCTAASNAHQGILVIWAGTSVVDSNVYANQDNGITAAIGAVILRNLVRSNGRFGIETGEAVIVQDNTVVSNSIGGISAGPGSFVTRNTLRSNTGGGIGLGLNAVASRNILTLSGGIPLGGGGISALDNFCDGVGC